ncbi:uncharacterized protein LOC132745352 [Ruditapes philippinarum]|uniref:uncharacterized protein LOC132745352 n=1 Tax=Ruditapes philippinarum TaxID=129788 RepID=UPI00295A9A88|nr:uncharacterized protein LOC132745352 [Ruditapes philippinarum]
MSQRSDYRENLSMVLSEVLDDIGVNQSRIMRRRKVIKIMEDLNTVTFKSIGIGKTIVEYNLGSRSEGTTTRGLGSDIDILGCNRYNNIIQDLTEWEPKRFNYLMIQDENTTPGYCFLQLLRADMPYYASSIPGQYHITDRKGRILFENTQKTTQDCEQHGPSIARKGHHGWTDKDMVLAFPCKSWPKSATGWLERQGIGRWPTQEVKRNAASTECFVVPTGSKVSKYPKLEWRISTSLAERCLMSSLNITQIRCFVLLKMILKSFLNPQGEINLSSFMCKTVLLHCIENTERSIWKENNLLTCLIYCLLQLHSCVQNGHLSHFIISENNLMAGQFTDKVKDELLEKISDFIQNDIYKILTIDIDDLGARLKVKLNFTPHKIYNFQSSLQLFQMWYCEDFINVTYRISSRLNIIFRSLRNKDIGTLEQYVVRLKTCSVNVSFEFLAPFIFTTYGSVLASSSIGENIRVPPNAMVWLSDGSDSDVTSSRLKLASVLCRSGENEQANLILRFAEKQYHSCPVFVVCICRKNPQPLIYPECARVFYELGEDCIKHMTAFCVKFIQQEINCVPHELQYEMFRSTQDGIRKDPDYDFWMDWAVVDSLPFIYFLQYKTYSRLGRHEEKQQALDNLSTTIEKVKSLGHKETALNLLGQCQEQEERHQEALECYIRSLQVRARNNVAVIHICKLLSRLLNQKTV